MSTADVAVQHGRWYRITPGDEYNTPPLGRTFHLIFLHNGHEGINVLYECVDSLNAEWKGLDEISPKATVLVIMCMLYIGSEMLPKVLP